jgi:hypothetical protein
MKLTQPFVKPKKVIMKIAKTLFIVLLVLVLNACKKNTVDPNSQDKRGGTISMQINGSLWSGKCGAVDAKIGTGVNVTMVGQKEGKTASTDDAVTITIVGYTGTGDYSATTHAGSGIIVIYNGVMYSNDKKASVQPKVKITEGTLPTTPLGPGKLAGEFSGTLKNATDGKTIELTNGKFETTDIL